MLEKLSIQIVNQPKLSISLLGSTLLWISVVQLIISIILINFFSFVIPVLFIILLAGSVMYLYIFENICKNICINFNNVSIEPFRDKYSRTGFVFAMTFLYGLGLATLRQAIIIIQTSASINDHMIILSHVLMISTSTLIILSGCLPLLFLTALWLIHVINQVSLLFRLLHYSRPLHATELGFTPEVPVHIFDQSYPTAYQLRLFGIKPAIVITKPVKNFPIDEIQAIYFHELYHIKYRHSIVTFLLSILPLIPIGPNIFLILIDFPQIERNADKYVVSNIGSDSLVKAIRRVAQTSRPSGLEPPSLTIYEPTPFVHSYKLLFGSLVMNAVHPSPDDRVENILVEQ